MSDISRKDETDEQYENLNKSWKEFQSIWKTCDKCKCLIGGGQIGYPCPNCNDGRVREVEELDMWPEGV